MKNSIDTIQAELAAEQRELKLSAVLTAATLLGLLGSILPWLFSVSDAYTIYFYLIAFLAGGFRPCMSAIPALLRGKLDIDLLMVLAALAAVLVGEVRDGAILLFLFSLAGTLEEYALGNTKRAVVGLMNLRPDEATLQQDDGTHIRVGVEMLERGQLVLVKAGERIPVDGVIVRGESAIDQSPITGESMPIDKKPEDAVFAGSVNGYGVLVIRVEKRADQSTLARMIEVVASAQAERSPSERFSEWFGSRYTFVVLFGSVAAFGVLLLIGVPLATALYTAATLLVVASPCAIVISVPAAVLSALAAAAKRGVLFKGGGALEDFALVDTVAFDKTGTLTMGQMTVGAVVPFGLSEAALLQIAASLEAQSEHPLAHSIVLYAASMGIVPRAVSGVVAIPGKGVRGTLDGVNYWAGNRRLLLESGISIAPTELAALEALEQSGKTALLLGNAERVLGCFGIADTVRPAAAEAVALLRQAGAKRVVMLTGDHESVAYAIGEQLGFAKADIYASLLPEDKVAIVKLLQQSGKVAFVGDGVNDAAALATADVGIAMGTAGSDVALEVADVALLSADLRRLVGSLKLAQKTKRVIIQNLIFAIGILVIMVIATLFFYLPLPLGVIGHEGGTLLVVLNGLRLLWASF